MSKGRQAADMWEPNRKIGIKRRRVGGASVARPGAAHDLAAARVHGIIAALTSAKVMTFADKAYQGAGCAVRRPFNRHQYRPKLFTGQPGPQSAQRSCQPRHRHRSAMTSFGVPAQSSGMLR